MPLKKPAAKQKIPKARKQDIDKLKDAVPPKKKTQNEYHCSVYFSFNIKDKKQMYCIELETVEIFTFLNYELSLGHQKNKKEIDIGLLGLKPMNSYLNQPQPAYGRIFLEELYGEHTINIFKKDGSANSAVFDFNIFKKEIALIKEFLPEKKNNGKFCTFEVAKDLFTFN